MSIESQGHDGAARVAGEGLEEVEGLAFAEGNELEV